MLSRLGLGVNKAPFGLLVVLAGIVGVSDGANPVAFAQNTVAVPQSLANLEGNTFTDLPFISSPLGISALQYIPATVNGNVAGLNVGDRITGLRFRLDNAANTNPFAISAADYDVYVGQGVATLPTGTSPASAGRQFANYYVAGTRQQVRDGGLNIPANSFPSSESGTNPEAFAAPIGFGTYDASGNPTAIRDFLYQGGALVFEIRFSGVTSVPVSDRIRVDLESETANANGYVLLFNQDQGANATTADARLDQRALVAGFDVVNIPEPASVALLGIVGLGRVAVRRRH